VALTTMVCAVPARAQATTPPPDSTGDVEFLPRTAFHLAAEHLFDEDPRFVWDADFGGELDIVDYGVGRFTFEANYEVVLGAELSSFEPNQGNYILAGLLSGRVGKTEVAAQLYHLSRHLVDRPREQAVDWNMLGARVSQGFSSGRTTVAARGELRGVVTKTTVDYSWELAARVRADVEVRPTVGLLAAIDVRYLGVDGSRDRGNQTGYKVEGGVRFEGRAGAVELFIAGERRIDPYPLEFGIAQWAAAGFRLLGPSSGP
jgi:hypothetical protein